MENYKWRNDKIDIEKILEFLKSEVIIVLSETNKIGKDEIDKIYKQGHKAWEKLSNNEKDFLIQYRNRF